MLDLGLWYILFTYLVIVGSSNAVNLTDGLDGLAIMPTVLVAGALGIFAYVVGHSKIAAYLLIPYIPGVGEMAVFCGAWWVRVLVFSGSMPIQLRYSWEMSVPSHLARPWV